MQLLAGKQERVMLLDIKFREKNISMYKLCKLSLRCLHSI